MARTLKKRRGDVLNPEIDGGEGKRKGNPDEQGAFVPLKRLQGSGGGFYWVLGWGKKGTGSWKKSNLIKEGGTRTGERGLGSEGGQGGNHGFAYG